MKHDQWPNRYWGAQKVPTSKAEFFNAVTAPAPASDVETATLATIRMYGPIDSWGGFWGISAKDVGQVLDAIPDSVTQIILRINSPGGEVWEAVAILNMLRAHKASVTAVVDGLAASAGSVIAAGCDETVMSPGTQMMIHSPWWIGIGNAADMRKTAEILDTIESSLIEIYAGKAGEKDWPQLLAAETWLTGPQTVELGLADRVAVIPDAGESETAGGDVIVVVPLEGDDEAEDSARGDAFARSTQITFRAGIRLAQTPVSTEPGEPIRKENVVAYDDLKAGLRERLGVTDADASDETLLAALDQGLDERADIPAATAALPEGATVIDRTVLDELRTNAALGAAARAEQDRTRRDDVVAAALKDGRITAASRETWRAQLDVNEENATTLINSLAKNSVPVTELGHSDTVAGSDEALYDSVYGTKGA